MVIEAYLIHALDEYDDVTTYLSASIALAEWCGGISRMMGDDDRPARIEIPTPEGTMTASPGDWIIRGVKGEFYPCKPDIFAATYEAVET
jgi:hypothetical protein